MNSSSVVLCADTTSLQHPEALGLPEETLARQEWLRLFSSGEGARRFLKSDSAIDEVWVVSSDDIDPINLAATLKHDRPDRRVCLLVSEVTGSLRSRATRAGIDKTLTYQSFVECYAQRKRHQTDNSGITTPSSVSKAAYRERVSREDRTKLNVMSGSTPIISGSESRNVSGSSKSPTGKIPRSAFLLPIMSASGGVGKSTVAVLSAIFSQGFGYKTLLADFDLQFGDITTLLDKHDALTLDDALAAPEKLAHLATESMMPAVLGASKKPEEAETFEEQTGRLLEEMTDKFEVIVVNTGARWTEQHAMLLERCSKALFLVDQRASSLQACRHALDLCARCGIATGPFQFVANRCSKHALYTSLDMSCALGGVSVAELQDGGRDVEELMGSGLSLDLARSRNPLCTSLEHVLNDLLPEYGDARVRESEHGGSSDSRRPFFWNRRTRKRRSAACPC